MLRPAGSVLIVDDDDAVREIVQDILEEEGYRVLVASSPDTALSILATEDVALVLLDHIMPSGTDATCQSIKHLDGRRPPVVLFSATSDAAGVAATVGADAWLQKPFEIEELLAIVRRYVRADAQIRSAAAAPDRAWRGGAGSAARRTR